MMFNIFQIKKVQEESKKVQEETFSFFFWAHQFLDEVGHIMNVTFS